ncbi:B-cell antigen receptor complex-associated protein alpha chain isoform X2 [Paroedura picta]|uniref:B-cell antigen receptor complex-associated protein alpha chain isoform X2 n=1 Tax=Paroedura picta TaxID=143630 RepID=UPI004057B1D1
MAGGLQWSYSLLFLGLLAGHVCGAHDPKTSGEAFTTLQQEDGTAAANNRKLAASHTGLVLKAEMKNQVHLEVEAGPSSVLIVEGHPVSLTCRYKAPDNANVTWRRSCSPNCSQIFHVTSSIPQIIKVEKGVSELSFQQAKTRDSGMYYCTVTSSNDYAQSCGTFLWVRRPRPASFLNIRESVKNTIITVEGFLLLIFAIGPGLFLLLRKWENESLLQAKKKKYEEENLYEGLNLDDCSMYEDISRGLQATYQDIGNVKVIDLQLEKPEKP